VSQVQAMLANPPITRAPAEAVLTRC
jgi:hypothetical protein